MKKIIFFLVLILAVSGLANTQTFTVDFNAVECAAGAVKIAVPACDGVYSIIIDSTGTDLAYDVNVYERISDVNYAIQKFGSLSSASEPYNTPINSVDLSSHIIFGYPSAGPIYIKLYNASGLTACRVIVKAKVSFDTEIIELLEMLNGVGEQVADDPNNNPAIHAGNAIRENIRVQD